MHRLIEEAIEALREMPEDRQVAAARAIIDSVNDDDDYSLSDAQVAEIERRVAEPNRKFITLDEVRRRLHPYGV